MNINYIENISSITNKNLNADKRKIRIYFQV